MATVKQVGIKKDDGSYDVSPIVLNENGLVFSDGETIDDKIDDLSSSTTALGNTKLDKENPVYSGSLSQGREETSTVGEESVAIGKDAEASGKGSISMGEYTKATAKYSVAEGGTTEATNDYAHAEGFKAKASGKMSHAEGNTTAASGESTHAEGVNTEASGTAAHAEGSASKATGAAAHAEGNTAHAQGSQSHAEGSGTTAYGASSHAQGTGTRAMSENQHVEGRYNIDDATGKYAHIVGNGQLVEGQPQRSNAATLDWGGNLNIAGNLTYNGNVDLASIINQLITTKNYTLYESSWSANIDEETSERYPFVYVIATEEFSSTVYPYYQFLGNEGINTFKTEDEIAAIELIKEVIFNDSSIAIYATEQPSVDLKFRVHGLR